MRIIPRSLRKKFRQDPVRGAGADDKDLDELSRKLAAMRGDNITVVDSAGNIPPNRDGVKNLANAARDGRYIDRSNEDDVISDLTTYRTAD